MHRTRLLRSSTFRYALLYMALFGASVTGVLSFVYLATLGVIRDQTDATIEAEILGLAEHYGRDGLPGLTNVIQQRSAEHPRRRSIYLLADPALAPIAGNLAGWPEAGSGEAGWIDFPIAAAGDANARPKIARARTFILPGGFRLLVGRDMTERTEFQDLITEALLSALGLTVLLGMGGGVLMSRNLLRRIEAINRGSRAILHGDLKQRMPVLGSGDEFDQLAGQLNAMLDQIEKLMTGMREVADNIAHDLRSPISRLRSRIEITLLGAPDEAAYRRALQDTIGEADAILATFNALLSIALAESGALKDQFERVDLAEIARDAAELYQPLAEEKGLVLRTEAPEELLTVGNPHLLSQAVANLLDNAIKYTPRGGRITLAVRRGNEGCDVAVADNGPGIPVEMRAKVLERFMRLEASRTAPGSGLGLSLAAAVARLHDATLVLEDNYPGLRVVLRLPADLNPNVASARR